MTAPDDPSRGSSGAETVFVGISSELLPDWVVWSTRSFPDTNLLLLNGSSPALIDTGFIGHADQTTAWVRSHTDDLALVVNTHWHADHVGGNALLQAAGVRVAASAVDAAALARPDPACCPAEYLDQPVAPYTVDESLVDGQVLLLGDAEWEVVGTRGHTPGHLSLWQPDVRVLITGDAVSDYDIGWINLAVDGPDIAATAMHSLQRLTDPKPRLLLPAHGPIPPDPQAALAAGLRRARRLAQDPAGAVRFGARRILAFALMIHNGIPVGDVDGYLTPSSATEVRRLAALADPNGPNISSAFVTALGIPRVEPLIRGIPDRRWCRLAPATTGRPRKRGVLPCRV